MSEEIGRFEIVIKNEGGATRAQQRTGAKPIDKKANVGGSEIQGKIHNPMNAPSAGLAAVIGAAVVVKHVVDEVVTFNNSMIEIRTGSKEAQARATYKYNTASSYISNALTYAAAGALAGGPVGAGVGALIGMGKTAMNRTINYYKNSIRLEKERELEDLQRLEAAQRETISGSRYMTAAQM
jgi:hypothetical protein